MDSEKFLRWQERQLQVEGKIAAIAILNRDMSDDIDSLRQSIASTNRAIKSKQKMIRDNHNYLLQLKRELNTILEQKWQILNKENTQ